MNEHPPENVVEEEPEKDEAQGEEESAAPDFLNEELVELDDHEDDSSDTPPKEDAENEAISEIDDALDEVKKEAEEEPKQEKKPQEAPEAQEEPREQEVPPEATPEDKGESEDHASGEVKPKKGKAKRRLLYALGLVVMVVGSVVGFITFFQEEPGPRKERKVILKPIERRVVEEKLAPFFVPLPQREGKPKPKRVKVMAYVEVTARWEKVISVLFKENMTKVRADLYWVLVRLLEQGKNPREMKRTMGEALTEAAKRALGVEDLIITVGNVKVI